MSHNHNWREDEKSFYVFQGWINYTEYCQCGAWRTVRKTGQKKEYGPVVE